MSRHEWWELIGLIVVFANAVGAVAYKSRLSRGLNAACVVLYFAARMVK